MKIYLGTDHAGFDLKEKVKDQLILDGYEVVDLGATTLDMDDDYPDFIKPVAESVAGDFESKGIIFGASGQGEAIVANRIPKARAVVYYGGNIDIIRLSREHNDANILSLGARMMPEDEALYAIKMWLETPFSEEERHVRRIGKIDM